MAQYYVKCFSSLYDIYKGKIAGRIIMKASNLELLLSNTSSSEIDALGQVKLAAWGITRFF